MLGVYAGGQLVTALCVALLGVQLRNPLVDITVNSSPEQLNVVTLELLELLFSSTSVGSC